LFTFTFIFNISIVIDKQVAEKKQRRAREWEAKIQRDKKYVNQDASFFLFRFVN
jgi:hypothetical protein